MDKINLKLSNILTHLDVLYNYNEKLFHEQFFKGKLKYEIFQNGIPDNGTIIYDILETILFLFCESPVYINLFEYNTTERKQIISVWKSIKKDEIQKKLFLDGILTTNIEYRNSIGI